MARIDNDVIMWQRARREAASGAPWWGRRPGPCGSAPSPRECRPRRHRVTGITSCDQRERSMLTLAAPSFCSRTSTAFSSCLSDLCRGTLRSRPPMSRCRPEPPCRRQNSPGSLPSRSRPRGRLGFPVLEVVVVTRERVIDSSLEEVVLLTRVAEDLLTQAPRVPACSHHASAATTCGSARAT